MLYRAMRSNARPAGKKPAEQSDVEKGGTDQQQKAELKPQILQSGDEKEGSDTMMVSYTDAFRVSNLKVTLTTARCSPAITGPVATSFFPSFALAYARTDAPITFPCLHGLLHAVPRRQPSAAHDH